MGYGFDFGPGIYLGGFFGGLGWGGWGWGPNWFNCSIFENGYFFNHYGFRGFDGRGFGGRGTWAHNPEHRLGVAYPNQGLANRFGGNFGGRGRFGGAGYTSSVSRMNGSGNGNFGNRGSFAQDLSWRPIQPVPSTASFLERQIQPMESLWKFGLSTELPDQPGIWWEPRQHGWLSLRSIFWRRLRGRSAHHARLPL